MKFSVIVTSADPSGSRHLLPHRRGISLVNLIAIILNELVDLSRGWFSYLPGDFKVVQLLRADPSFGGLIFQQEGVDLELQNLSARLGDSGVKRIDLLPDLGINIRCGDALAIDGSEENGVDGGRCGRQWRWLWWCDRLSDSGLGNRWPLAPGRRLVVCA